MIATSSTPMTRWYRRAASRNSVWRTRRAAWSRAASAVSRGSGPSDASDPLEVEGGRGHGRDCTGVRLAGPCLIVRAPPVDSPGDVRTVHPAAADARDRRDLRGRGPVRRPGGRFNVAPTDEAAVVVQRDDQRAVVGYRWGLIPGWADDPRMRRARSTPAPRPSRPARCSATRSAAGGASSPSTASTSGCARARRASRCGSTTRGAAARAGRPVDRAPGPRAGSGTGRSRSSRRRRTRSWRPSTTGCRSSCRRRLGRAGSIPTTREPGELRALLEPSRRRRRSTPTRSRRW